MILFDTSQVIISSSVDYWRKTKEEVFEIDLLRHIALSTLLSVKDKVTSSKKNLGDIVLCFDGRNYWRKKVFPLYKKSRAKSREKDKFDWEKFYETFRQLKEEWKESLPVRMVEVDTAEADDIISVLSRRYAPSQEVIIVSSDHDFIQLHRLHPNIHQYSPFHKKYLKIDHNDYKLFEHIVKGDSGDGIPNILSDDDVFISENKRSKPISKKKLEEWAALGGIERPERFCTSVEALEKFKRNRLLVDLTMIPEELSEEIIRTFESSVKPTAKYFEYLVHNGLKKMMERGKF